MVYNALPNDEEVNSTKNYTMTYACADHEVIDNVSILAEEICKKYEISEDNNGKIITPSPELMELNNFKKYRIVRKTVSKGHPVVIGGKNANDRQETEKAE